MDNAGNSPGDATGFALSRRSFLVGGASIGVATSLSGCNGQDDSDSGPGPGSDLDSEQANDLVAEGLALIDVSVVTGDSGWIDLRDDADGSPPEGDYALPTHVRVLLENESDEPISVVNLSVEAFDEDTEFLGVETARITSMRPGEVFEGHVPLLAQEPTAYVVRADRSKRPDPVTALETADEPLPYDDVEVVDDCREGNTVRGTLRNTGSEPIDRLRVDVRFYDDEGRVLTTAVDTIVGLEPGAPGKQFQVDLGDTIEPEEATVDVYRISVGNYGGETLAVH